MCIYTYKKIEKIKIFWLAVARLNNEGKHVIKELNDQNIITDLRINNKKCEMVVLTYPGWKQDKTVDKARCWAINHNILVRFLDPYTWKCVNICEHREHRLSNNNQDFVMNY